jgi:hypothetical protein
MSSFEIDGDSGKNHPNVTAYPGGLEKCIVKKNVLLIDVKSSINKMKFRSGIGESFQRNHK